jgi:TPR repeat protein
MRSVLATKREVNMSERKLLFLMNAEQAEAFSRLVDAANRGDGGAACQLGDMSREGLGGLRFSPKETHRWYARSAMAGDANGQNNLGACYEHGLGCVQSYAKAVKWYRLSAAQKLGTASMNLGYCYLRGTGLASDKDEALRFFRLAAEQGEPKAVDELERLGEPVSEQKVTIRNGIRFVDETALGKHFGLIGIAGVTPPAHVRKTRNPRHEPDARLARDHHQDSVSQNIEQ